MKEKINKIIGKHLLAELIECQVSLDDINFIQSQMEKAAIYSNATIVKSVFHHFNPCGISGVVVIAESHLTIHTWPEFNYAAIDIFTCGDTVDPWLAFNFLKENFKAMQTEVKELSRGYSNLHSIKLQNSQKNQTNIIVSSK